MAGRDDCSYTLFGSPAVINVGGLSVVGTAGSITGLATSVYKLPYAAKIVGATRVSTTGGTAAGPTLLLQYSLAGTGTWTSIGTCAFGTDADGTTSDFSVTATSLSDGDCIRCAIAAGTAASTHTTNVAIEFIDLYE